MSIPNGPSALAVKEAAWGLARYASIAQVRDLISMQTIFVFFNWSSVNSSFATWKVLLSKFIKYQIAN